MTDVLLDAKRDFPGTATPDHIEKPKEYGIWWRRMGLWAYKYGPALMDALQKKEGA